MEGTENTKCPECDSSESITEDDCQIVIALKRKNATGQWIKEEVAINANLLSCGNCLSQSIQRGKGKPIKIEHP